MIQAGGMKLRELHVATGTPARCHSHAVAGGNIRIGRVQIHLAAPACRHHMRRARFHLARVSIQCARPRTDSRRTTSGRGDQIDGEMVPNTLTFGVRSKAAIKARRSRAPWRPCMQHRRGMPALFAERKTVRHRLKYFRPG